MAERRDPDYKGSPVLWDLVRMSTDECMFRFFFVSEVFSTRTLGISFGDAVSETGGDVFNGISVGSPLPKAGEKNDRSQKEIEKGISVKARDPCVFYGDNMGI